MNCRAVAPLSISRAARLIVTLGLALVGPVALSAQEIPTETPDNGDPEELLGKRSSIRLSEENTEWIRAQPGVVLYQQANRASAVLEIVAEATDFEVLDQRGSWIKVLYRGRLGWLIPDAHAASQEQQLPRRVTPDEQRLLRARSLLGESTDAISLGPFELYTDVNDADLLDQLSAVAVNLPEAFTKRFGLDPGREASEAVVIFAKEEAYRRFEAGEPEIAGTGTRGYTGAGVSIFAVVDSGTQATVEILIHELSHILNRRVFGMSSPAWIEEGLADDLALSRVGRASTIQLGTLNGSTIREVHDNVSGGYRVDIQITGGRAKLSHLLDRWGDPQRPSLVDLFEMPWIEFVQPEVRSLHYAQSAFLVRYLLESKKKTYRQAFLDYLQALSSATIPQGISLWSYLDDGSKKVEAGYFRWLKKTAAANGL